MSTEAATREASFVWECRCGWLVAEIEYLSIIIDAPCPRCKAKYSTFHRKQWPKPNRTR